ncbi:deoxyribodipyrimidine photo-lyase [Candidatus Saccharibacteria bacterium]|nr:deoxyribodipyrimidine photo-lyase [Candidatus Saccharibacteria bacterium]
MDHRALTLNASPENGDCVVYIMSRDQRVYDNYALLAAQDKASTLSLPLVVVFRLLSNPKERALEHAQFMLGGLEEVATSLKKLSIPFILTADNSDYPLPDTLQKLSPAAVFFDFSPLKGARAFAKSLVHRLNISGYVVDTHNIIPAWYASDKQEFAAHTFRRKVHRFLESYVQEPTKPKKQTTNLSSLPTSMPFGEAYSFIKKHYPSRGINIRLTPGEFAAKKQLSSFIEDRLATYATDRNNIAIEGQSMLSPYLHFGQLSSLRVALEVLNNANERPLLFDQPKMAEADTTSSKVSGMNALFEEMIVRKELSDNFCLYSGGYTTIKDAPQWAQQSLNQHRDDPREFIYTLKELEAGKTHDELWNAAQHELTQYGKMHGYMRMYWAKKILEWTSSPEEALSYAITLNDRYSIDGGDPNGYVGMLWSIAGLHDRPWFERPVFGKVRYMNDQGLKRKFDTQAYIRRVS